MSLRLLLSFLAAISLVALIAWSEIASWHALAALEQRLTAPGTAAELREPLRGFRFWLIASTSGMLVLVLVLGRAVKREVVAPLQRRLVETSAVLARQEKLAALGVLAAGVAHEIRNPLTAIKARLFSQRKRLLPQSLEMQDAELIKGEIDRLEQIVKDFLLFARPSTPVVQLISVDEFVQSFVELIHPELSARKIRLAQEVTPGLQTSADPGQLRQVLLNLTRNASDSLTQGGTITLRVRSTCLPFAPKRTEAVAFEVEDDGPGVAAEVQQRLFDPFFTTKDTGTGLGLAIAERITDQHGGTLQFRSRSPHGAIFTVILPAAPTK